MSTKKQKEYYIELLHFYNEFSRFGRFISSSREMPFIGNFTINRLLVLCGFVLDLIENSCPDDIRSMLEKYGK